MVYPFVRTARSVAKVAMETSTIPINNPSLVQNFIFSKTTVEACCPYVILADGRRAPPSTLLQSWRLPDSPSLAQLLLRLHFRCCSESPPSHDFLIPQMHFP